MAVKRQDLENRKHQPPPASIIDQLRQLDLPQMSLQSLLQFGTGLLIKEAIAQEITDYLGRARYEHGESFRGHRNGSQKTRIDTASGVVEYDRPKVAYAPDFKSQYHVSHMKRPEEFAVSITDMYVGGVSTRKIKKCLKSVAGEKTRLSRSTVSRITKRLRNEFAAWKTRSLDKVECAYLFLDAIRVGIRMGGQGKDAVLLAYGIMADGTVELLSIDLGHSESGRSWGKLVSDLKARGLKDPLLVCSDGNQGVINAIDSNFVTSYRQRCVKHREQNILDAVPKGEQKPVAAKLKQIFFRATSLEQAKKAVQEFRRDFGKKYPSATERLLTDLDQCLSFYLFPTTHWKRMRTSNKIERLNKEIRRRLKVIGRHPDETGCLALIYGVSKQYSSQQRKFSVDDLERQLWKRLREEKKQMLIQLELDQQAA
jgi:transposase-like protein